MNPSLAVYERGRRVDRTPELMRHMLRYLDVHELLARTGPR